MADTLNLTLGELLAQAAARHPQVQALVDLPSGARLTYAQLNKRAEELASGFVALGLAAGEHLALWAPNRPEWIICQFAAAKAGLVLVTLEAVASEKRIQGMLARSQAAALVMAPGVEAKELWQTFTSFCPQVDAAQAGRLDCLGLPHLKHLVCMGPRISPGAWTWNEVIAKGIAAGDGPLKERAAELNPMDTAGLFFTSGTTGEPKGVMNHHFGLVNTSCASAANQGLEPGDRLCVSVPLFHMFGSSCVVITGISRACTLVLPAPLPQTEDILEAVEKESCVAIYGPPTTFIALRGLPQYDPARLASMRTGIMAGAQCPTEVMSQVVNEMGVEHITVGFGQTEASSWVAQTRPGDPLDRRVSTVGRALPGVEVKILDLEQGGHARPGEIGELLARGFNMNGYFNNPQATQEALDQDGWLHTGDLASLDEEGYIRIWGRAKDVIRRQGKVVFPTEIEEVLFAHPHVMNAQVFGVPHPDLEEEVLAWVKLESGAGSSLPDLLAFLADKLPAHSLPGIVEYVDEFPMTPLGKIQKFKMREMFQETHRKKQD